MIPRIRTISGSTVNLSSDEDFDYDLRAIQIAWLGVLFEFSFAWRPRR